MSVIFGTVGNDVLNGTPEGDTISGLAGNDTIYGGNGNSDLNGNKGADIIFSRTGNDTIHGGRGNDTIYGGAGNDIIWGDRGRDILTGGLGNDLFVLDNRDTATYDLTQADLILDFNNSTPIGIAGGNTLGRDILGLTGGLVYEDLYIYNGVAENVGSVIIQDKVTGKYLAILKNIDQSVISSQDFTTSIIPLFPTQSEFSGNTGGAPLQSPVSTPTPTPTNVVGGGGGTFIPKLGNLPDGVPVGTPTQTPTQTPTPTPSGTTPLPDLTVTKTSTPNPVNKNGALTYTITVSNIGNADATGISLLDNLPSGLTNIVATSPDFTLVLAGNTLSFSGGSLNAGASGTITITANAPAIPGQIVNTVTVDPNNTIPESNENNNTATNTTTVLNPNFCGVYTIPAPPTLPKPPNIFVATTGTDAVGNGTAAKPYKTIQFAINQAAAGDVISVAAGTYAGANITKTVTLVGPNANQSPVTGARNAEAIITTPLRLDQSGIPPSQNVQILGFTFDASGGPGFDIVPPSTFLASAPITAQSFAANNPAAGDLSGLVIQSNRFINIPNSAIALNSVNNPIQPAATNIRIIDNFIDGDNVNRSATATSPSGILIFKSGTGVEISNNVIQEFDRGITIDSNAGTTIQLNKIQSTSLYGIQAANTQTDLHIEANKFVNNNKNQAAVRGGIVLSDGYRDAGGGGNEICGNDFDSTTFNGVSVRTTAVAISNTTVEGNNFFNGGIALRNDTALAFKAIQFDYYAPGVTQRGGAGTAFAADIAPSAFPYGALPPF